MLDPVRRVVAGHDANGKAIILTDGPSPTVIRQENGFQSFLLWVTDETPADNKGDADAAARSIGIPPPAAGSIFRIVDFPPEGEDRDDAVEEGRLRAGGAEPGKGHPGMHRTDSIDYAIIMAGEIDMLVDDGEVHLKAGDVVVQRGNMHAWANRGGEICRIAFILIDAEPAV